VRRPGLHHRGRGLRHGGHDRGLHHRHGSGLQAYRRHRRREQVHSESRYGAVHCPVSHHAVLHRAGHGRAHHRQLLHHGLHLRADSDYAGHPQGGGALLRVLFRHRGRHHPAGGAGRLRRLRHREIRPYENGDQRHKAGHRGFRGALHLRHESLHAAHE